MQGTSKHSFESEGFRANSYLEKQKSRWEYIASSKLTTVLAETRVAWKTAKATPKKPRVTSQQMSLDYDVERRFQHLAETWRTETKYLSSLSKMAMHPAYQKIIGMGKQVIPLILRELRERGGHWLWALHVITDEDPAPVDATFAEAVQAWLRWGRSKNYIS
jgi:hypothetical protein